LGKEGDETPEGKWGGGGGAPKKNHKLSFERSILYYTRARARKKEKRIKGRRGKGG